MVGRSMMLLVTGALALGCGGASRSPAAPCTVRVTGPYDEHLLCSSESNEGPGGFQWLLSGFVPAASQNEVITVGVDFPTRPVKWQAYGFDPATSSVDRASLSHWTDFQVNPASGLGSARLTHEASVGQGPAPVGSLSVTFTELPPPGSPGAIHGTAHAVLPGATGPLTVELSF